MLVANLAHATESDACAKRLAMAFEWLAKTDLVALEPGRHEILGDDVLANVMEVATSKPESKSFEAHKAYIDVHYVIKGEELIGVAPVSECPELQAYAKTDDYGLYGDPAEPARVTWVTLRPGELCVTPPADAHKPACASGDPVSLKKVCVKVRV